MSAMGARDHILWAKRMSNACRDRLHAYGLMHGAGHLLGHEGVVERFFEQANPVHAFEQGEEQGSIKRGG